MQQIAASTRPHIKSLALGRSRQVRDIASDSPDFILSDGSTVDGGANRIFELMCRRRAAGSNRIDIPVVNSAVINQSPVAVKHCHLGRDLHLRPLNQLPAGVLQSRQTVSVFAHGFADRGRRFTSVGIHQPELALPTAYRPRPAGTTHARRRTGPCSVTGRCWPSSPGRN